MSPALARGFLTTGPPGKSPRGVTWRMCHPVGKAAKAWTPGKDRVSEMDFFLLPFSLHIYCMACRILVPQPGMEPMTPGVGAQSLNHWTAREVPTWPLLKGIKEITMTQWPNMLCIIKGAIASIEEFDTIFIKTNFMYVYTDLFA